jgi:hypothetical protein
MSMYMLKYIHMFMITLGSCLCSNVQIHVNVHVHVDVQQHIHVHILHTCSCACVLVYILDWNMDNNMLRCLCNSEALNISNTGLHIYWQIHEGYMILGPIYNSCCHCNFLKSNDEVIYSLLLTKKNNK